MQELIDRLTEKAGITAEQAQHALEVVKDFVKEKFPMLEGAVENIFNEGKAKGEDLLDGLKDKMGSFFS
ncbi:hypothetical protein [Dinghuibacter silviterrae]|jgi:hypothetical protein|uniref:DUF2267 domain-containing protein n=1 Tax=Dinghuibacter silviterrae TaxID=1539049 RepID=A0A4R8DQ05_9BACT|nr:hypothetical protein [Dinghuibacter silviterrae]TDX00194.1 hypothetical protein EDB95_1212 [Dinghuibacter silviterrae]